MKRWTSNIKYFLIAIIILILGYFFGIIILAIIAIIILLMSVLFLFSLIFNKSVSFFFNKRVRLFLKMFFSLFVSYGFVILFYNLVDKITNQVLKISVIWAITAIVFGTLWNLLVIKRRVSYKNKVFDYSEPRVGIQLKDLLFMIIIPVIFTIAFSILKGIIIF
jgi:hypothetical protein